MPQYLDAAALFELAQRAEHADAPVCGCTKTPLDGWQSQPLSLDERQLEQIGTLIPEDEAEPTFSEYLPENHGYWSDEAPIAPRYFPYNRCGVWKCTQCGRLYLRYTEGRRLFRRSAYSRVKSAANRRRAALKPLPVMLCGVGDASRAPAHCSTIRPADGRAAVCRRHGEGLLAPQT